MLTRHRINDCYYFMYMVYIAFGCDKRLSDNRFLKGDFAQVSGNW